MKKLIDARFVQVETSKSILSFERVLGPNKGPNGRFLRLGESRAYYLGTACDTCPLLFERLDGSNQKVSPQQLSDQLRQGLSRIDEQTIEIVKQILPKGEYLFCLLYIAPRLIKPGDQDDYFCKEQIDVWGIDPFWGLPHHPKTEYYRSLFFQISPKEQFYEFEIPLYPQTWLEPETVLKYQTSATKNIPTALSLSILEIREPAMNSLSPAGVRIHASLLHYLLDGHHKTNAAAQQNRPLSLLACISLSESNLSKERIEQVLEMLENQSV